MTNKMGANPVVMEYRRDSVDPSGASRWKHEVPGSERSDEEPKIPKSLSMRLIRGTDLPWERAGRGPGSCLTVTGQIGKKREEGSYQHLVPVLTPVDIRVSQAQYPTGICPLTSYAGIFGLTVRVLLRSPLLLNLDSPLPIPTGCSPLEPECDLVNVADPEFDNDRECEWPFPMVFWWLLERVREVERDLERGRLWLPCRSMLLDDEPWRWCRLALPFRFPAGYTAWSGLPRSVAVMGRMAGLWTKSIGRSRSLLCLYFDPSEADREW